MKKLLSFLSAVVMTGSSWAGGNGTSAAEFLKAGAGAKASAMGEACSALVDDASAIYWNPGALSVLPGRSATLMHAASVESTAYSFGAYAQKIGDLWGAGAAVQYQTAGSLTGRDENGFETAGFSPKDSALIVAGARKVGPLSLGLGIKQVQSKIIDSASTVTGDVGVLWPGLMGGKLSAALTATNLGGKITYDKESEDLPSAFRLGFGYRPSDRWALGLDAASPNDGDTYFAAGAERIFMKTEAYSLAARAGYNTRSTDAGSLSGFAAGLGFGLRGLSVDYAFLPMGDLGQVHRVSMSYGF